MSRRHLKLMSPPSVRLPRVWLAWGASPAAALVVAAANVWAALPAPVVRVVTEFDRTSASVGDTIRYTVSIDHAAGVEVAFPEFPDTIAGLAVRNFGPLQTREVGGRVVKSRWYDIEHFLAGSYTIPGVAVEYAAPGKQMSVLRSADMFIQIESLIGQEELGDIRDIPPPLAAASRYMKYYVWGFAVAGLVLAAVVCGIVYQRHRAKNRVMGPPPVPAHELAYAQLEQLLQMDLIAAGRIKAFYYRLSDVLRHYIENRFHLMAPERTTEEFLVEMASTRLLVDAHKGLVSTFLDHCDLVKFAKYAPKEQEIRAAYDSAVRLIDETKEEADMGLAEEEDEFDG